MVASLGPTEEVWRRAIDLNLRYYAALGRLTSDYVRDLLGVLGEFRPSQPGRPPGAPAEPASASPPKRAAVMVLEEEVGGTALGVFLVENHLNHEVSARPVASAFVDSTGREVRPVIKFDPEVVALRPAEHLLVRVTAAIDETFEPEIRYEGELTIPELSDTRIPIVLRRRASRNKSPDPTPSVASAVASPKKSTSSRRGSSSKAEGSSSSTTRKGQ